MSIRDKASSHGNTVTSLYGLLMLRRNLAREAKKCGYQLKFPLFDFACFWYFRSVGKSNEEIKNLFTSDELDFVTQLIDGIAGIPWVSLAKTSVQILTKYIGVEEKLQHRGIDERKVAAIQGMDAERELIFYLPEFLASDLNAAMAEAKAPQRLVLFFDTHEKFWGKNRDSPGEEYFYQDEWLRNCLCTLEFSEGIVVVLAGQDPPKWANATKHNIPEDYIDLRWVLYLTTADARLYLNKAGIITREKLAEAMIDYASVSFDQVHPLLLGLCVDVVESAEKKQVVLTPTDFSSQAITEHKPKELIERLLKYVVDRKIAYAVRALSACRAFNYQVYQYLGQALNFSAMQPDFDLLTEFSFVWQDEERGEGWYRIHDLLRRLEQENPQQITLQAHKALETYWQEKQNIAEAIYHSNCLDWEEGLTAWVKEFESALRLSRYDLCRSLLEICSELDISTYEWLGDISSWVGKYFAQLALHAEVKRELTEAISAYDQALNLAPNYIEVLNNQGLALIRLGDLQARLAQHQEAVVSYRGAISSCDRALTIDPNNMYALNTKGNTLTSLGELQARLAQYQEAVVSYGGAISSYDRALTIDPNNMYALNNQGTVLQSLGELQARLAQHQEAVVSYGGAISFYDRALTIDPNNIYALNNKGLALTSIGNLQVGLQNREAEDSYRGAVSVCDQTLALASDDIYALNIKGLALRSLGELQARLAQHPEAVDSYGGAIAAYDRALTLAPDDIYALNNQGLALASLGELQAGLAQHREAVDSYQQAIAAYDRALTLAPDRIEVLNNQGLALISLGNLYDELSEEKAAIKCWQAALNSFSHSLKIAPSDPYIQNLRDELLAFLNDNP